MEWRLCRGYIDAGCRACGLHREEFEASQTLKGSLHREHIYKRGLEMSAYGATSWLVTLLVTISRH